MSLLPSLRDPAFSAAPGADRLWLAPLDSAHHPAPLVPGAADYMQLFRAGATWPRDLGVRVIKLYPFFATYGDPGDLQQIIRFAAANGLKIALESGVLSSRAECGRALEGYNGEILPVIASRIKGLGGKIDYLAMDEPLWFGHAFAGPGGCQRPIQDLANDAARNIGAFLQVMPDAVIGDVEPAPGHGMWTTELAEWFRDLTAATGRPVGFLHLDIAWSTRWQPSLASIRAVAQASGMAFGLIYNASAGAGSDDAWVQSALRNAAEAGRTIGAPDQVVFQTWDARPTRVLPESAPDSLTGFVRRYLASVHASPAVPH